MSTVSFGPLAQRVAARLPAEAGDVVVADLTAPQHAVLEAYRRRARGDRFRAMIVVDDESVEIARRVSRHVVTQVAERHERLRSLGAFTVDRLRIEGKPPAEIFAQSAGARLALMNVAWISGEVLVRSLHEQRRLFGFCGNRVVPSAMLRLRDPRVPRVQRRDDADRIVLWAPDFEAAELGPTCLALQEMRFPVLLVTRDGQGGAFDLPAVTLDGAAEALASARLIIDATTEAPDSARALADVGAPLLVYAPFAIETDLAGAVPYQPENNVVISAMVRYAMGLPARRALVVCAPPAPAPAPPAEPRPQPLVSIVVPTCGRPQLLRRALRSIERQRWPVEALVVNDGDDDIGNAVAAFPRARQVANPRPGSGPSAARNLALDVARGEFVGFLDDDDLLFPDHAERMVTALENSRADFVQSDVVACYARWADDGRCRIEAIEIFPTLQELRQMAFTCLFVLPSLLFRRRLLQTERFDDAMFVCEDYELWLRLMRRATPCYQPVPTSAFISWANGPNNSNLRGDRFRAAYASVYARHPSTDPHVLAQREKELARLAEHGRPLPPSPMLGRFLVDADLEWLMRLEM